MSFGMLEQALTANKVNEMQEHNQAHKKKHKEERNQERKEKVQRSAFQEMQKHDQMQGQEQNQERDQEQNQERKLQYIFSDFNSGRPYCRQELTKERIYGNMCAVFDGSKLVYAAASERFTKKKNDFALPLWALRSYEKSAFSSQLSSADSSASPSASSSVPLPACSVPHSFAPSIANMQLQPLKSSICTKDLHLDHIYEAFYLSGFDEAAILVASSCGNTGECITLAYMQKNKLAHILRKIPAEGCFEGGFSFGAPAQNAAPTSAAVPAAALADASQDAAPIIAQDAAQATATAQTPAQILSEQQISPEQEGALLQIIPAFQDLLKAEQINTKNLCLSGNAILNPLLNSKIVELGLFEHYYASPQPADACALSIGHAFRIMQEQGQALKDTHLSSPYLGASYSKDELTCPYSGIKYPIDTLCEYLSSEKIIIWYQDGSEFGSFTLGHRSFLADPTNKGMLLALNKIKGETQQIEAFPVVPEELFTRIFEVENTDLCECKLRRVSIKKKWQSRLQAICRADGTTCPQLLRHETNPELYNLLMAYFEKTKVPCLINFELAVSGFPLAESPRDLCEVMFELSFMKDIPDIKTIYIEHSTFRELALP